MLCAGGRCKEPNQLNVQEWDVYVRPDCGAVDLSKYREWDGSKCVWDYARARRKCHRYMENVRGQRLCSFQSNEGKLNGRGRPKRPKCYNRSGWSLMDHFN